MLELRQTAQHLGVELVTRLDDSLVEADRFVATLRIARRAESLLGSRVGQEEQRLLVIGVEAQCSAGEAFRLGIPVHELEQSRRFDE